MAKRDELIKEIELRLGGQMVDVELDPEHYDLAIKKSFEKYRQRSENAVEEAFVELSVQVDVAEYTLSDNIIDVYTLYRRGSGTLAGSGGIEPFETQYLNNMLLSSGRAGGMATFDALAQHRETLGRLFGKEMIFTWNTATKKLFLQRRIKADDTLFMHVYKYRSDEELLTDTYSLPWIKELALAYSKLMLAEARGKFNTIAGPQGGTSLNADALRMDAQNQIDKLEDELKTYTDGQVGLGIIIG
jgi:hypothetical protein|tara:strand:- start:6260 stop:6994 length:735 start_codon:yes stop_codon:yes gene_type:complete